MVGLSKMHKRLSTFFTYFLAKNEYPQTSGIFESLMKFFADFNGSRKKENDEKITLCNWLDLNWTGNKKEENMEIALLLLCWG